MAVKKLNDNKFDDYKDLYKTFDYDKKRATRLAEAMTEKADLLKRIKYLDDILKDNTDLSKFLWTTADGVVIAIHDIEDDHLKNIIGHVSKQGGRLSSELMAEIRSRGIDPDEFEVKHKYIEAETYDDDPFWD